MNTNVQTNLYPSNVQIIYRRALEAHIRLWEVKKNRSDFCFCPPVQRDYRSAALSETDRNQMPKKLLQQVV